MSPQFVLACLSSLNRVRLLPDMQRAPRKAPFISPTATEVDVAATRMAREHASETIAP